VPIVRTADHAAEAVTLLLQQLRGKPAAEALITALTASFDDIETDLIAMLDRLDLAEAEGEQLDGLGDLVNLARGPDVDDDFRTRIEQEIALQRSDGTGDEIILASFVGFGVAGAFVHIEEPENAAAEFEVYERTPDTGTLLEGIFADAFADRIFSLVNRARAAGVYFVFLRGDLDTTASTTGFSFDTTGVAFDGGSAFRIVTRGAEPVE
jgi:hypothetical protein